MQLRSRRRGISRFELALAAGFLAVIGGGISVVTRDGWAQAARSSEQLAAPLVAALTTWEKDRPDECPTLGLLESEGYLEPGAARGDAWGSNFRVACVSGELAIVSPGPDTRIGTQDDLRIAVP